MRRRAARATPPRRRGGNETASSKSIEIDAPIVLSELYVGRPELPFTNDRLLNSREKGGMPVYYEKAGEPAVLFQPFNAVSIASQAFQCGAKLSPYEQ